MVRSIVAASLKFRLLVLPLAAALLVVGVIQLRKAPVDVLPEFTLPVVEVQTESLGLSAPEVEQLITVPMEQDLLNGVMGVDTIRSDSVPGLSDITMVFEKGTNILQARQLVQERLTQAHALPNVSKPPQMLQPVSSTSRVMMIGMATDRLSPIELSVLARWTVRPRLMGLEGAHIEEYAKAVVKSDLELPGDEDVLRKVFEDLKGSGVAVSEGEVRMKMAELLAQARESAKKAAQ